MTRSAAPSFVLTAQCPDTTGVVAAIAGFLAAQNGLITELQHFDDEFSDVSFVRVVFHDNGRGMPAADALKVAFDEVASRFDMQWTLQPEAQRCRIVIAVSRAGHCLNSMLHRWSTGALPVDVAAVVSNHQDLRSLTEWHGVPYHYFPLEAGRKREQEARIHALCENVGADLLVLARYMQILSPEACAAFAGRAINIHHSFLPSFKGAKPYAQAHTRGVKLIGATAHFVTTDLDEGPIIEQEVARVDHTMLPEELAAIGSDLESSVLNRAVKWFAERRVFRNGLRTVVLR